ncbi:hypothetical protein [Verrucomicrobium spinosum]|uniref:hypothetical protein n=1 Tax=Verrucomicrobium spinosum TaxID=2736 RepID=UPI00017465DD|nr:hypothetical protein [Verrucomicrobium spinosum]
MSESKDAQTALLQALHDQGVAGNLVCRFRGYGVLVLCLPEYGNAEQLLLEPTPPVSVNEGSGP